MTQNDPQEAPLTKYIKYIEQDSLFETFWCTFSHRNGSNLPLILYFNLEAFILNTQMDFCYKWDAKRSKFDHFEP